MLNKCLALRPWPLILAAYLAAPVVAMTGFCVAVEIPRLFSQHLSMAGFQALWVTFVILGEVAGVQIEFLVVTPLLLAFLWGRWRWLNTWTIASIGLIIGIAGQVLYLEPIFFDPRMIFPVDEIVRLLTGGYVGMLAAITFRLIAFYRVGVTLPHPNAASPEEKVASPPSSVMGSQRVSTPTGL